MNISFILILIFVTIGMFMSPHDTISTRKKYINICNLFLLLTLALRSITVGADTITYYEMYEIVAGQSWDELFASLMVSFVQSQGSADTDVGYSILCKLCTYITTDYHVFTFIAQLLFFVPFGNFLLKYAKNIYQIIFAYSFYAMLLIAVALLGARQVYAIGIDILVYMYFLERKYVKSTILLFLALTIHLSSILILLPIALTFLNDKWLKKVHLLSLFLFPVVYVNPNIIIRFMGNMVQSERYAAYGEEAVQGGANTFVILLFLISLICYFVIKEKNLSTTYFLHCLYCMVPCFTFFGPLINSNGTMIRISMYFHMYVILLLPIAIELYFGNNKFHIYKLVYILMIVLTLITGTSNYEFFWDIDPVNTW